MDERNYDCLIIGGGVSGISFAHYLHQQGKKVLILEKQERIGGQIHSPHSKLNSDYWRELGAHTCYNSYTNLLSIIKQLGLEEYVCELEKASYVIFADGRIKSVMKEIAYPSLMFNGLKLFFSNREGKTVREYFQNIVGKKNYEKLFTRLFRAVLSQSADDYPAEIFLKRRAGRFEDFPRKLTFSKGQSSVLDLIVEKNNIEVVNNTEVVQVSIDDGSSDYQVRTSEGLIYSASNIAFATDPQTTADLLNALEIDLVALLRSIPMFHSESMNVIVPKEKLAIKKVAGIIPTSDEFLSAVSRDLIEDEKLRSFTFHFLKGEKNKQQKIDLICEVLGINEGSILEIEEDSHILPSLLMKHLDMASQVSAKQKRDNLFILGNYFYGLSLEDCVNRSSDEAKRFAKD